MPECNLAVLLSEYGVILAFRRADPYDNVARGEIGAVERDAQGADERAWHARPEDQRHRGLGVGTDRARALADTHDARLPGPKRQKSGREGLFDRK